MSGELPLADGMALGTLAGASLTIVAFSLVIARTMDEAALRLHAAGVALALPVPWLFLTGTPRVALPFALLALATAGVHLHMILSVRVGPPIPVRRAAFAVVSMALAGGVAFLQPWFMLPAAGTWCALRSRLLFRRRHRWMPWRNLSMLAAALLLAAVLLVSAAVHMDHPDGGIAIGVSALLVGWAAVAHLVTVWRSRLGGETRARMAGRARIDPLTGLPTALVFVERVGAASSLALRHGVPSVVLLVQVENLEAIVRESGRQQGEEVLLATADFLRRLVPFRTDVVARVGHDQFGMLVDAMHADEVRATVSAPIAAHAIVAPVAHEPCTPARFRVAECALPAEVLDGERCLEVMRMFLEHEQLTANPVRVITLHAGELITELEILEDIRPRQRELALEATSGL